MKQHISREAKTGIFVALGFILALGLAWMIGVQNPFQRNVDFFVDYDFAGGLQVGSPVRVSGIKVGKVKEIEFFAEDDVPVRITVSVLEKASKGIHKDSRFFINLAGIIGERYVEITPGAGKEARLKEGDHFKGENPPRIDQIFSQSFNLAGKVIELIEKNEGDIGKSIQLLYKLSENLNKTVIAIDKSKMFKADIGSLINNLIFLTTEAKKGTELLKTEDGEKTLKLLYDLLWRLEPLDEKAIKKFFQDEGIRTKIF